MLLRFTGLFSGKYMYVASMLRHRVCYTVYAEYGGHTVIGGFVHLGRVVHGIRLLQQRY